MESNGKDGLRAFGPGGIAKAEQCVSRRNALTGIVAEDGAKITASGTSSLENRQNGAAVQGANSEMSWSGGTINDNGWVYGPKGKSEPLNIKEGGLGVSVEQGGSLFSGLGVTVSGNRNHGVVFTYPRSGSTLVKCMIRENGRSGLQIFADAAASLRIEGGEIAANPETGLDIGGKEGFRPVLYGVRISGNGVGLSVLDRTEPQLEQCVFENNKPTDIDRAEAGPGMTVK